MDLASCRDSSLNNAQRKVYDKRRMNATQTHASIKYFDDSIVSTLRLVKHDYIHEFHTGIYDICEIVDEKYRH